MPRRSSVWTGAVGALFIGVAAGIADARAQTVDILYFVQRGDILLSPAWASTFADPGLQAGPAQVGGLALIAKSASLPGISEGFALSVVVQATLATMLAVVTGYVLVGRSCRIRFTAQMLVVGAALATLMLHRAYTDGHPAQVVIPLLWIAAGLLARQGRPVVAGLLLGLSAGFETWGMLGVPMLLLGRDRRASVLALGGLLAVVAALYVPFVLAGDFRMFAYTWRVVDGSPASLILSAGSPFTWWMRTVQGAAALGAGAFVALRLRRSPVALWTVPLVVVLVRVSLEPQLNDWYLIAVETSGLVAAADLFTGQLAAIRSRAQVGRVPRRPPA
jgi:hypothetical protein